MTTRIKRITPCDAFRTHPTSFDQSVFFDRFERILRASRSKAARSRHPSKTSLVATYQEDAESFSHRDFACSTRMRISATKSSYAADAASAPATKTRSSSAAIDFDSRMLARKRRFRVFLLGFPPIAFAVAIPTCPVPGRLISRRICPRWRFPSV